MIKWKNAGKSLHLRGKRERYSVSWIKEIIDSNPSEGKVFVLYGLRQTGKTDMMEQIVADYLDKKRCAFYYLNDKDTMDDIRNTLASESWAGTEIICFDYITRVSDFVENAQFLSEIAERASIYILVTGSDTTRFFLAERNNKQYHIENYITTYVSFREHCYIFDTDDMDDYIQSGGVISKTCVLDFGSTMDYLAASIFSNIVSSIEMDHIDSELKHLDSSRFTRMVEKQVGIYCGLNSISFKDRDVSNQFTRVINDSVMYDEKITDAMVLELEEYLFEMDFLSLNNRKSFFYTDEEGWNEGDEYHEVYVVQPAIKYNFLVGDRDYDDEWRYEGILPENEKEFRRLSLQEKQEMRDSVKDAIAKQIVAFEMSCGLKRDRYYVCIPDIVVNGQKKDICDVLIHDKSENRYWGLKVNRSDSSAQKNVNEPLLDERITDFVSNNYEGRKNISIYCLGDPFQD